MDVCCIHTALALLTSVGKSAGSWDTLVDSHRHASCLDSCTVQQAYAGRKQVEAVFGVTDLPASDPWDTVHIF